jgi:hypothetical protein
MSRDNLKSLLDSMLDDSAVQLAAEEQTRREAAEREERERHAAALAAKAKTEPEAPAFDDIEQLTGLTEPDLRAVLQRSAPDDLLVILATADDVLQRRMLRNLSAESVAWLRENLQYMERVTDAERDGARRKVLGVANRLLGAGEIAVPEPESVGAPEAPVPEEKDLRELLTDLVRIAEQSGPEALRELAESAGEPLLRGGLALILEGADGAALGASLEEQRAALEARYAQRLAWMEEAILAIAAHEPADAFRARFFASED